MSLIKSDARAKVIGLPDKFDFLTTLRGSTQIRLVTAFAHRSGWRVLEDAVEKCKGNIDLFTGASFFHTEPAVLTSWLKLSDKDSQRVRARLQVARTPTFHPKVLIVDGIKSFAIVGSGNLSNGGLIGNVECGVYVSDKATLLALRTWFDSEFVRASPLRASMIKDYAVGRKIATTKAKAIEEDVEAGFDAFDGNTTAELTRWESAVKAAKAIRAKPNFAERTRSRAKAAKTIRTMLDFPHFNFSNQDWDDFISIKELGHLRPAYKADIYAQMAKVQAAFRHLLQMGDNEEGVLDSILLDGGKFKVRGIGINIVSKILVAHDSKRWAILNDPVRKVRTHYRYEDIRGTAGAKYLAYIDLLKAFKKETGLKNGFDLDVFFFQKAKELEKAKTAAKAAASAK